MKGFPELGIPLHIITLCVVMIFFALMLVLLFKYRRKIDRYWDYVIALFILGTYTFVFLEKLSNSNIDNHFVQTLLPWHNFAGFIVIIGSIAIMLPRKLVVRKYILSLSLLMSSGLVYGMFDTMINYIQQFPNSYREAEFWIYFFQVIFIIYCIYSLVSEDIKVTWKEILFSIVAMSLVYGVSLAVNLNTNLALFGVGKYFFNLIQYPHPIYCLIDFASIVCFVFVSYMLIAFPISKLKVIKD